MLKLGAAEYFVAPLISDEPSQPTMLSKSVLAKAAVPSPPKASDFITTILSPLSMVEVKPLNSKLTPVQSVTPEVSNQKYDLVKCLVREALPAVDAARKTPLSLQLLKFSTDPLVACLALV